MIGVLLAGGKGDRMNPFSKLIHKSLLPLVEDPVILNPLQKMAECNVSEIYIIGDRNGLKNIAFMLGDYNLGRDISFVIDDCEGGCSALYQLNGIMDDMFVVLSDNVVDGEINKYIDSYNGSDPLILIAKSHNHYDSIGIPKFDGGRIARINDGENAGPGDLIATGYMVYNYDVFSVIREHDLFGESLTSVNNIYAFQRSLVYKTIPNRWFDIGSPFDLADATSYFYGLKKKRYSGKI